MVRFWSICKNTFVQTIRQPIFFVLVLLTFLALVISVPLSGWTMNTDYHKSDQMMLEELGLSTLLISGLLVAAFSASSVLHKEIEQRTVLTVVSKPVSRALFVLGKFAGVALAVSLAFYLCGLAYLMTVRHRVMPAAWDKPDMPVIVLGIAAATLTLAVGVVGNYLFGWNFFSTVIGSLAVLLTIAMGVLLLVGKEWKPIDFGEGIRPQLIPGMVLTLLAVQVFVAVAVAAGTRLGQVMILLICCAILAVGWVHYYLFGVTAEALPALRVVGWLFPDLRNLDPQDPLSSEMAISARYMVLATAYALTYIGAVLATGIALFQTRALETQGTTSTMPGLVSVLAGAGRLAAVLLAIGGVSVLSLPGYHNLFGILLGIGLLAAAVGLWMVWGAFGRGVRWGYAVVGVVAVVLGVRAALVWALPGALAFATVEIVDSPVLLVLQALLAAAILTVLVLPKTRRHFQSQSQ